MAEREKAAPALRILHCDEAIALRGEARVEARGRVRDESCGVGVSRGGDGCILRVGGQNIYITALLLVESGRVASDGLKAPARHHLVWMCGCAVVSSSNSMSARELAHGINFGRRMDVG